MTPNIPTDSAPDTRVWRIVSDYLGNSTEPYSTQELMDFARESNEEFGDEQQHFNLRDQGDRIVDLNRKSGDDGFVAALPYEITLTVCDNDEMNQQNGVTAETVSAVCEKLERAGFEVKCNDVFIDWNGGWAYRRMATKAGFAVDGVGFVCADHPLIIARVTEIVESMRKANARA